MKKSQIALVVFVLICVIVAGILIKKAIDENAMYDEAERTVQNVVNEAVTGETHNPKVYTDDDEVLYLDADDPLLREIDFEYLKNTNSEVLCWIYIPDTYIDFYVMQEPKVGGSKYMWTSIHNKWNGVGSIFHPAYAPGVTDAQNIYFGHHMSSRSKQMFSTIPYWEDEEYGQAHHYLYIYYPDRAERWDLFSVLKTDKNDKLYEYPYILGSQDYADLLTHLKDDSVYQIGPVASNDKPITTFSTCRDRYAGGPHRFTLSFVPDMVVYYTDIGKGIVVNDKDEINPDEITEGENNNVEITHTVNYEDLEVGKKYTIEGILVNKDDGGVVATASTTVVPTESSGAVTLTFTVDKDYLSNKTLFVTASIKEA